MEEAGNILVAIEANQGDIAADIDRLVNYNEGSWKIITNQMIFYNTDDTEFMRFDLFDASGQPVMRGATQRVKVV